MKREIAEATLYNVTCGRVKGKDLIVTPEMLRKTLVLRKSKREEDVCIISIQIVSMQ